MLPFLLSIQILKDQSSEKATLKSVRAVSHFLIIM